MSGICGYVLGGREDRDGRGPLPSMLRELGASTQGAGGCVALQLGSVGLGVCPYPGRFGGGVRISVGGIPVGVVVHGSIYNVREFFGDKLSESEIYVELLNFYIKEGIGFHERLRGEYVLSIWDGRDRSLHIAVDPFRVHPLYYCEQGGTFAFASRLKALAVDALGLELSIRPEAIVHVVAGSMIPTPKSIYREIRKLPSGHYLTFRQGEVHLTPYWHASFLEPSRESEGALAEELRVRFREALSVRLGDGAPADRIGTFLSGGVDSSAITGVLASLLARPPKSFSIGFGEPKFNEIRYARIAAKAFGSEHHEYFVSPADTDDFFPRMVEAYDEPFGNASAVPSYFCARLAREHGVDVLFAGDGGDEFFAGNERYSTQRIFEPYHRIPGRLRDGVLTPLLRGLSDTLGGNFLQKAAKYARRASLSYSERIYSYDFFRVVPLGEFLEEGLVAAVGDMFNPYEEIDRYYADAPARTDLDRHLCVDWKLTLTDNDLIKVTRATELAGVTVRYPFLDRALVEFSTRIPSAIKMKGRRLRSFFKDAYAELLPLEIREKQKHGFGLPIPVWLKTDARLNDRMRDLVLSERSIQRGYFRRKALETLVDRHRLDETSFSGTVLWNLMVLEMWIRQASLQASAGEA